MNPPKKYQWPVIIAASLHGALFLCVPDVPPSISAPSLKDPLLPPMPHTAIEMVVPALAEDTRAKSAGGDPSQQLPDNVVAQPDPSLFVQPVVEVPTVNKLDRTMILTGTPGDYTGDWIGVPGSPDSIIDVRTLDRIPRATVQPSPDYPRGLQLDEAKSTVVIEFVVNESGRVVSAEAVRYSHRELVEPAVRAVMKWRFEAGTRSGRPVSFRMAVPIEFSTYQS